MTGYDLNRDQLEELKQRYLTEAMDERGETPSLEDLANADNVYSDDFIYKVYAGYIFSPDDFASGSDVDEMWTGRAAEIDKLISDLNRIVDGIFAVTGRKLGKYGDLYNSLAAANNELVMARMEAQDIEWGND